MRAARPLVAVLLVVLAAVAAPGASAYRLARGVVAQPVIRYYVHVRDWRAPFARVVRDLDRAHVGVRLVAARIAENAPIQVGRLEHRCGLPGVEGTTQTFHGGYAAIYLPRGCHGAIASIIAAHELGHALGLHHEDRRCALMNSSGSGPESVPTHCPGRRHDWFRHPFRTDDLAGLRRLYRNTPPRARLALARAGAHAAQTPVRFVAHARDSQHNLSVVRLDWGDGTPPATGYAVSQLARSHVYASPGRYRATLTAIDLYGRRGRARVTVRIVR